MSTAEAVVSFIVLLISCYGNKITNFQLMHDSGIFLERD